MEERMSTDVITETAATPRRRKRSSTAAKLIQAAALAAVLVPLGSIAMEGASITCGYSGASSPSGCGGTGNTRVFDFDQTASTEDNYKVIVEFFDMSQPFQLTVTDNALSHEEFLAREGLTGTYDCVDVVLTLGDEPCREFEFVSNQGEVWGSYKFSFVWDYPSDANGFPNGVDPPGDEPGAVRILQNKGEAFEGDFTIDMCLAALEDEAFTPCDYEVLAVDPRIGSGNTDFSTAIVGIDLAAIPEPSSLILLSSGVGAWIYRKRRRTARA
jgi:hypothetical protein